MVCFEIICSQLWAIHLECALLTMTSLNINLGGLNIPATRREVTMVLAIDTSASMNNSTWTFRQQKSRLQTATEGACKVLDALGVGDDVKVISFDNEVRSLNDKFVKINSGTLSILKDAISDLRASGQTRLYDTIINGCEALGSSASLATDHDFGTFWLVVLTDGEDTCSNGNLNQACVALKELQDSIGDIIVTLIGVKLGSAARRSMLQLAVAAGAKAHFVDAQDLSDVTKAFDKIAIQVSSSSMASVSKDDDDSPWPGVIQKGMHVRCIGHSRGVSKVSIGDVGVVEGRDPDGDYRVNFPKQDNWRGQPKDLVIDYEAEKIRPGALVALKPAVSSPQYGMGNMRPGKHGLVVEVTHDGNAKVKLGFDNNAATGTDEMWTGLLSELEVIDDGLFAGSFRGCWSGKLQLGQAVRIPGGIVPSTGRGNVKDDEVGYVRGYSPAQKMYFCDFPSRDLWVGREGNLQVDLTATLIRPGKQVRLRPGVSPHYGMGSVSRDSVGIVLSCTYNGGIVTVMFPEDGSWKGRLSELETLDLPVARMVIPIDTKHRTEAEIPMATAVTPELTGPTDRHRFPDGKVVQITGLNSAVGAPLNGKLGKILAFADKKYLVERLCGDKTIKKLKEENLMMPLQEYSIGTTVRLHSLQAKPELNGTRATIVSYDPSTARYEVSFSNETSAVRAYNFEVIAEVEELD